jgi:hypothetical protein
MLTKSKQTIHALASASALTAGVIRELMGNEIANTINNSLLGEKELSQLVSMRVASRFTKYNKMGAV